AEAPLNFRGEVAVNGAGEVDLKKFGSRIFVDAARIFALTAGTPSVNTSERLHQAGKAVGLPESELASLDAAFSHILRLRLTQQIAAAAAG
ncbi:putative nucleotidyltransferase substrate binding domain-containing protein, partial [Proteus faecis]|uniref:putative nucleotidyltransferase substrate binding domain-containing protein n=1 Tax=Proteus faecis TaxID=2050967 RepID=UPI003075CB85